MRNGLLSKACIAPVIAGHDRGDRGDQRTSMQSYFFCPKLNQFPESSLNKASTP